MSTIGSPAAVGRRIHNPLQRDSATFLQTSAETGGARTLLEFELAPGGGNSPHRHRAFAERFEVVSGELTVEAGGRTRRLGPGDAAEAPAGVLHRFANQTAEPAVFRVELTPGHQGFERSLQIAYGLARDGLTRPDGMPRSLVHGALLVELSDTHVPGLMGLLTRLLSPLARRARRRGVERELIARYGL